MTRSPPYFCNVDADSSEMDIDSDEALFDSTSSIASDPSSTPSISYSEDALDMQQVWFDPPISSNSRSSRRSRSSSSSCSSSSGGAADESNSTSSEDEDGDDDDDDDDAPRPREGEGRARFVHLPSLRSELAPRERAHHRRRSDEFIEQDLRRVVLERSAKIYEESWYPGERMGGSFCEEPVAEAHKEE